jgi:hypothetical protein
MKTSEILTQAKALIADPEHWIQGWYARIGKHGRSVWSTDANATCFCSLGALGRVTAQPQYHAAPFQSPTASIMTSSKAQGYLERSMGGLISIFNDEHAHAEVMAAWDQAIALAVADGD